LEKKLGLEPGSLFIDFKKGPTEKFYNAFVAVET
jgi:hypothetical protein